MMNWQGRWLSQAPEGAENPGEVGGDCSGVVDILGSELTEEDNRERLS